MFEWVAGFSAAIPKRTFDDDFPDLAGNPQKEMRDMKLLWVGCGKGDELFPGNERFHAWLDGKKVAHTWHPSEGVHAWPVWREYLEQLLPLLFD
jgi:enterochelin esterase family protein